MQLPDDLPHLLQMRLHDPEGRRVAVTAQISALPQKMRFVHPDMDSIGTVRRGGILQH